MNSIESQKLERLETSQRFVSINLNIVLFLEMITIVFFCVAVDVYSRRTKKKKQKIHN